ncbi:hypothetical protein [Cellulophaga sp. Z1A5H]|nr:hypothetical protein [Cellulophaga sp. Z1A5H]
MKKKILFFLNNSYIVSKDPQHIFPFIFGGIGLLFFIFELFDWIYKENWDYLDTILLLTSIGLVIFFAIYYFTIPLKQVIYNRYDGLITFPGFLWNNAITMKFKSIRMLHAGGALGSPTADMLYVKRPDKLIGSK